MRRISSLLFCAALLGGCSGDPGSGATVPPPTPCAVQADCAATPATPECAVTIGVCAPRAWHIGVGNGSASTVELVSVYQLPANEKPTGLAFNPQAPSELWVVTYETDTVRILYDPGSPTMTVKRVKDPAVAHFMHQPTGIAFGAKPYGDDGKITWGTCGDNNNPEGGNDGFMGPALFPTDLAILGKETAFGLGSHLDMLHNSPFCMGIAYEQDNIYWVFDGSNGSLARYDFQEFHEPGGDDHSDGEIEQYVMDEMLRSTDGVPSHLVWDSTDGMVYAADTGHGRVVKLDPSTATRGRRLPTFEPTVPYQMNGATLTELVPPGTIEVPSGVALDHGVLYITDNATSRIHAVALDGTPVRTLETGLPAGSLGGIAFGLDEKVYLVDMVESRVLRLTPNMPATP